MPVNILKKFSLKPFRTPTVGSVGNKKMAQDASEKRGDSVELGETHPHVARPRQFLQEQTDPETVTEKDQVTTQSSPVSEDIEALSLTEVGKRFKSKEMSFAQVQKISRTSSMAALTLLGKLPAKSEKALAALSSSDQSKVLRLLNTFSGDSLDIKGQSFFPTRALSRLLQSEKLTQQDRQGNSLLSNLDKLSQQDAKSGTNLAAWFTVHAADPKRSYRQLPESGTCVATSLSYMALESDPAEVSRIVLGVAREGKLELANGESINRAVGSEETPTNGASPVEQLLQASLTDYADSSYQYDFKSDQHFNFTSTRRGRLWVDQQLRMADVISGTENKAVSAKSSEIRKLFEEKRVKHLAADVFWEKNRSPSLFNKKKHGRHMVVLTGVDDKFVYFRNPHGSGKTLVDSSHQANDYGFGRFEIDEFDDRLHHVIVDSSLNLVGEEPVKRSFMSHLDQMFE